MRVGLSLSKQILLGLTLGVIFGLGLQLFYVGNNEAIKDTLTWTNVVGSIYVNLLRMVIMPLVLTMMIAAVVKMRDVTSLGKVGFSVVGILMGTTMIWDILTTQLLTKKTVCGIITVVAGLKIDALI